MVEIFRKIFEVNIIKISKYLKFTLIKLHRKIMQNIWSLKFPIKMIFEWNSDKNIEHKVGY